MQYGICNLSIVPVRLEPSDSSEMVTQLLYGDHFKVLEKRSKWSRIRIAFDAYEGWIDNKQYLEITDENYNLFQNLPAVYASDLIEFIYDKDNLIPIPMGAGIHASDFLQHRYDGAVINGKQAKENLIKSAMMYLNAPYLWGGKTHFGIDCSVCTQMGYRMNGYALLRDASQQATQGEPLSFIEESEPGDLAFFDNNEGKIVHVGIILQDNYIIHAHGKVRMDRIDHSGIFNTDIKNYTHKLRVIKKIF